MKQFSKTITLSESSAYAITQITIPYDATVGYHSVGIVRAWISTEGAMVFNAFGSSNSEITVFISNLSGAKKTATVYCVVLYEKD